MYKLLRSLLFCFDAEKVHYFSMNALKLMLKMPGVKGMLRNKYDSLHPTTCLGMTFKNPVGLAAGFDKNAKYLNELEALGFGFIEIGTVTPLPQNGNEKPRLFRLPKDKALINRMGFNNDGAEAVAARLMAWRQKNDQRPTTNDQRKINRSNLKPIVGGNLGKNKLTSNEDAWKDYGICFNALHPFVDYFVVNVSSPNTPGLRELQEKESLRKILTHLREQNKLLTEQKPILLKIAPDLSFQQINDVIDLAMEINLDGLVAANTTIVKKDLQTSEGGLQKIGPGGLSGAPLRSRSTEIVNYISAKTAGKIPLISSGGIFTGQDAAEKINAGASLIQVWTGFIYEGPSIVKKITKYLAKERVKVEG